MIKKLLSLVLLGTLFLGLAACEDPIDITIDLDFNELTLIEGETYQLDPTTNDQLGPLYSVSEAGIISLSNDGLITANNEGTVTVYLKSRTDSEVQKEITVYVRKEITLVSNVLEVNMIEEDTHQLVITSNDDVVYEVMNKDIIVIDENGLITAKEEGQTTITVTSTYDSTKSVSVTINVDKLVTIDVPKEKFAMVVGDTDTLGVTSNDGLIYKSGDSSTVTVSDAGELTAVSFGTAIITITSTYNEEVEDTVEVKVYKYTEGIEIDGIDTLISGTSSEYIISATPVGGFEEVTWESSDTSILTVDDKGIVTAVARGNASVVAKSVLDDTIADTFDIEVINVAVVDQSKQVGDTYDYEGVTLEFGISLFATIQAAIDASTENTIIYIEAGNYVEDIIVNKNDVTLLAINNPTFEGVMTLAADNLFIKNFYFTNGSKVVNSVAIDNLLFKDNTANVTNTYDIGEFMKIDGSSNITITDNIFVVMGNDVLTITDFTDGEFIIMNNSIHTDGTVFTMDAVSEYDLTTEIKIMWNEITLANTVFDIDLMYGTAQKDIYAIARFNEIDTYTVGATVNANSEFDFTLNYWGKTPVIGEFVNVDEKYIKGYYATAEDVLTESEYDTTLPIIITITNPIEEIMIGETHTFEYEILPYELSDAPIKFITGDSKIVAINQTGTITPLISGDVNIQVRSAQVSSIRTQDDFSIITTPGIEITTDNLMNDLVVGETLNLGYITFPYTIDSETASFTSSDTSVATISTSGLVNAVAPGVVTFTATLDSDSSITQTYTINVYNTLDMNNPLDYLTTVQVSYSTIHDWTAYGFAFNYSDTRAESVSRYYFSDGIEINTSKIVPIYQYVRPGYSMNTLPAGVTQYNTDNIHWVVVHDTASTATGSGALAHANYLMNQVTNEVTSYKGWHYTIDDELVYQHVSMLTPGLVPCVVRYSNLSFLPRIIPG